MLKGKEREFLDRPTPINRKALFRSCVPGLKKNRRAVLPILLAQYHYHSKLQMNVNRPPSSYVNPTLAQKGCFYKHSYQSVSMKLHILYHCICLARFYLCIYAYLSVYMSICVYMCTYVCIQHMCIKNYKHTYCKYGDISACNPSTF